MSWFDTAGKDGDVVIASRVTLTRNVENYPFDLEKECAVPTERKNMLKQDICDALEGEELFEVSVSSDENLIKSLEKKQYVDPDIVFGREDKVTVMLNETKDISAVINGRDQITLRALTSGNSIFDSLKLISSPESHLDRNFNLAYSKEYGYLTSRLSYLGTAAEYSFILHLPTLKDVKCDLPGMKISKQNGDIFILSSLPFPGITEEEQAKRLELAASDIISKERAARSLLRSEHDKLCDKVSRAYGILSNTCIMEEDELFKLWSDIRLGAVIGLPEIPSPEELGSILMSALVCPISDENPNSSRADILKRRFGKCEVTI